MLKGLRLIDAIPISRDLVASSKRGLKEEKQNNLKTGNGWAIALTGPDGEEYLLPFKLMQEITDTAIKLRRLREPRWYE